MGHLVKGQWVFEKKKERKKEKCLLALKPEQGLRGIWWKSLKSGALSLHWLGVIDGPPLHGQFIYIYKKKTFKPCTPTMKKNGETKGCVLSLLNLVSLLSVEKELGWGERLVQHTIFGN